MSLNSSDGGKSPGGNPIGMTFDVEEFPLFRGGLARQTLANAMKLVQMLCMLRCHNLRRVGSRISVVLHLEKL